MSEVTRLLDLAQAGDPKAAAGLLPLVYDELRKLAAGKMMGENPDHTLNATALVHEAYLRLTQQASFESRSHFMRAAAEAMRRILVDHARRAPPKNGADVESAYHWKKWCVGSIRRIMFWPWMRRWPGSPLRSLAKPNWSFCASSPG